MFWWHISAQQMFQSYGRIFLSDSYYVIKYNDETMEEIKY